MIILKSNLYRKIENSKLNIPKIIMDPIITGMSLHDLNILNVGKFKYATAVFERPIVATVRNAINPYVRNPTLEV
jgi:hypothetical protein